MMNSRSRYARVTAEPLENRLLMAIDLVSARAETQPITAASSIADDFNSSFFDDVRYVHDELGLSGLGQTVAIIDSGIAYDHAALGGGYGRDYRVVGGYDFAEPNALEPYDDAPAGFHGTHVAGIIASDDAEFLGLAPNVDLVGLRIFNDNGFSRVDWLEDALQWVHEHRNSFEHPITTVNVSVGVADDFTSSAWQQINDELKVLHDDGLFITVAAGNSFSADQPEALSFPGESDFVVPVSSVDMNGLPSEFAQRRGGILAAPGENIVSTATDFIDDFNGVTDDFASSTGTSMAAPFVAAAGVLVREAMQIAGRENVTKGQIEQQLVDTADQVLDPLTGQSINRINLRRAVSSIVEIAPTNSGSVETAATIDLGEVAFTTLHSQELSELPSYSIVASRDGWLTIDADRNQQTEIVVRDQRGEIQRPVLQHRSRIDVEVERGKRYTIRVHAEGASDVAIANLFSKQDNQAFVSGTLSNDEFVLDAANRSISVNGISYGIARDIERIELQGHDGENSINAHGTRGDDQLEVRAQKFDLSTASLDVTGYGFADLSLHGKAGTDAVSLFGSKQTDVLDVNIGSLHFSTPQNDVRLYGFETTSVFGGSGSDIVRFRDTPEDDRLLVTPGRSEFTNSLAMIETLEFERTFATARRGHDTARIEDSSRDDHLRAKPQSAYLWAPQHLVFAKGFSDVEVHAVHGGKDKALLFDSAGNDKLVANSKVATLSGPDFENRTFGFESVLAYAGSGTDNAELSASEGDDHVAMLAESTRMTSAGSLISANTFETVTVETDGRGTDQVFMFDSIGNDDFLANSMFARLSGENFYNLAKGFAQVFAFARFGGNDRANLFDSTKDDLLTSTDQHVRMQGNNFWNQANGFELVTANASSGNDEARIEQTSPTQNIHGRGSKAVIERLANTTTLLNFDSVVVEVENDEAPNLDLSHVDFAFASV